MDQWWEHACSWENKRHCIGIALWILLIIHCGHRSTGTLSTPQQNCLQTWPGHLFKKKFGLVLTNILKCLENVSIRYCKNVKHFLGTPSVRFANVKLVGTVILLKLLAKVQNVLHTCSEYVFLSFGLVLTNALKRLTSVLTRVCKNVKVFKM